MGYVAATVSTASFAPQAWKVIVTRDTEAIATSMYILTVSGFALWLAYGLGLKQWPLVASNSICLFLSAFILVMKLLPQRKKNKVARRLKS